MSRVVGITTPMNIITNVVPAAGPASAAVFGTVVYVGAEGPVVFSFRPDTRGYSTTATGIICSTTVGTNTPTSYVR